jgi:hypothetical protein
VYFGAGDRSSRDSPNCGERIVVTSVARQMT